MKGKFKKWEWIAVLLTIFILGVLSSCDVFGGLFGGNPPTVEIADDQLVKNLNGVDDEFEFKFNVVGESGNTVKWAIKDKNGSVVVKGTIVISADRKGNVEVKLKAKDFVDELGKDGTITVSVVDSKGQTSDKAVQVYFNKIPKVTLVSPENNGKVRINSKLEWRVEDTADEKSFNFEIYFRKEGQEWPESPNGKTSSTNISIKDLTGIKSHNDYQWKVKVIDQHGASSESPVRNIEIVNTPPNAALKLPETENAPLKYEIKADIEDVDSDALNATVTVLNDEQLADIDNNPYHKKIPGKGSLSYTVELQSDSVYKILLEVDDGYAGIVKKEGTIKTTQSPAVVLIYPNNGQAIEVGDELRWKASDPDNDPFTCEVHYKDNLGIEGILGSFSNTSEASVDTSSWSKHQKYYWWVKVCDDKGACVDSEKRMVKTRGEKPEVKKNYSIDESDAPLKFPYNVEIIDPDKDELEATLMVYNDKGYKIFEKPYDDNDGDLLINYSIPLEADSSYTIELSYYDVFDEYAGDDKLNIRTTKKPWVELVYPDNGATIKVGDDLKWNGGDPNDEDIVSYTVYYYKEGEVTGWKTLVENVTYTFYPTESWEATATYHWYVKACDDKGACTKSEERVVHTAANTSY